MSETFVDGAGGSATLPGSHYMKVAKWTQKITMKRKDVSCYGGGRFAQIRGGMISGSGLISGYLRVGGGATNSTGATSPEQDGAALTLTVSTQSSNSATFTGTAIFGEFDIQHDFCDPAIPVTIAYDWNGTITEAWF